ncbi:MAG: acyltransferase family protein [Granulosicoccus sp.]
MPPLRADISDRIFATRLLCVLCMMYVHVPSGVDKELLSYTFSFGRFDHWLEAFLVEGPGRAGAALLSVVSGFLVARALLQPNRSTTTLYIRRFQSTIVPMMLWGILVYGIYFIISQSRDTFLTDIDGWVNHINVVFFLTEAPFGPTMHLAFLRDLFVCVLLSPVLLILLRYAAWPVLLFLAWIYLFQHDQNYIVVLRPLVVFAFAVGMVSAIRECRVDALDAYWGYFLGASLLSTFLIMWFNGGGLQGLSEYLALYDVSLSESILYPSSRVFGSLAIWTILAHLTGPSMRQMVNRCSPYLFAAFCSHHLFLTIAFHVAWEPVAGGHDSFFYIVWFVSAPLLAFLLTVAAIRMLARVSPGLASLVTGGRVSSKRTGLPRANGKALQTSSSENAIASVRERSRVRSAP